MGGRSGPVPGSKKWLKWVGLAEPPSNPDAWTVVAEDIDVAYKDACFSQMANQAVDVLQNAGIEARQRTYVADDTVVRFSSGPSPVDRLRVAVLVHNRDLKRAAEIIARDSQELARQVAPISDEELAAQALQAGPDIARRTLPKA